MKKILYVFLIVITLSGISNAKLLYVDIASGSDTNAGDTWSNSFASITSALDTAVAGDTVYINQGIYEDYIANYNFTGYVDLVGVGKVKLWRRDLVGSQYNIYNCNYLSLENIGCVYDNTYNIYYYSSNNYFKINNCIIPNCFFRGSSSSTQLNIFAYNSLFNLLYFPVGKFFGEIKNCDFINNLNNSYGISVNQIGTIGIISNNNFYNYTYGIYSGVDLYTSIQVLYNNFDNCTNEVNNPSYINNQYPTTYKSDFIDTSYYPDGFLLKPTSQLFYSGEIINGIPAHRGRGLLGIMDNYDSTQFANWTDETGATIPVSNILVFDTTGYWTSDSGITLKGVLDTGYLISPFYYFSSDSDILKSFNIDLLEEYKFISGAKQIIDADTSTAEREFEYSFDGSTWYMTTSGKELNIPLQDKAKVKFRFLLRRNG